VRCKDFAMGLVSDGHMDEKGLGAGITTQPAAFGAMLGRVAVIPCGDELEIEEIRRRVSRRPVVAHKSICCDLQLK
jgi:hypothetical protein